MLGEYDRVIGISRLKGFDLDREDVRREDQKNERKGRARAREEEELSSQLAWRRAAVEYLFLLFPFMGMNAGSCPPSAFHRLHALYCCTRL